MKIFSVYLCLCFCLMLFLEMLYLIVNCKDKMVLISRVGIDCDFKVKVYICGLVLICCSILLVFIMYGCSFFIIFRVDVNLMMFLMFYVRR